jgi:hypothetical protein
MPRLTEVQHTALGVTIDLGIDILDVRQFKRNKGHEMNAAERRDR